MTAYFLYWLRKNQLKPAIRICGMLLLAVLLSATPRAVAKTPAPVMQAGDLVAVCGDSITEQRGYSAFMAAYFMACQPAPDLRTIKFGWSGEWAKGLLKRLDGDVIPFHPTVATTCYGMNDGDYAPATPETLDEYRAALTAVVRGFKAGHVRLIVVGSPGVVDLDFFHGPHGPISPEAYNQTLAQLTGVARQVAQAEGVAFANIHDIMLEVMKKAKARHGPGYFFAGKDGMHPPNSGHLVMAYAILKALGCNGDIGTITLDARTGQAGATAGHKIISVSPEGVAVESVRYPFCFTGAADDPTATKGIIEFFPFNHDLNRFVFRALNVSAKSVKVTWGNQTRIFSAETLAQGVNLAEEFPDNPFSQPFQNVMAAVVKREEVEISALKYAWHALNDIRKTAPDLEAKLAPLKLTIAQIITEEREQAQQTLVPVRHIIKIEPAD